MARSDLIHRYLSDLETYLSRVSEARAQEVVQEIESHIYDTLALQQEPEANAIEAILGRLGTPRELAAAYIEHITIGVAPPKGLKPLSRIKEGVSKSFYYVICALGYGTGAVLLLLAVMKLLMPSALGVWVAEHGNSIVISFSQTSLQASEIPGMWLIPLSASAGVTLLYLTNTITRILRRYI